VEEVGVNEVDLYVSDGVNIERLSELLFKSYFIAVVS
jgi:hypothetical protein